LIDRAVRQAILSGHTTPDLGGRAATSDFAKRVAATIK
jgi:isocitrate/isopropylmalate dehydrogenase